jgi:hypothetical protein
VFTSTRLPLPRQQPFITAALAPLAGRALFALLLFALPYHLGHYDQIRERTGASLEAYYAEAPGEVAAFAERYGVDLFLVNRLAYDPVTAMRVWEGARDQPWEPFTSVALRKLNERQAFALPMLIQRCASVVDGVVAVVPTRCVRSLR